MKIGFYKVDNSLDFDRHSFDDMSAEQIELHLQPLLNDNNEAAIVNLDDKESVEFFTDEYNDELYDGGWWCVLIKDADKPKNPAKVWVVSKHFCVNWSDSLDMVLGVRNSYEGAKALADEIFKEVITDNPDWNIEHDGVLYAESPQGFSHGHISIEIKECDVDGEQTCYSDTLQNKLSWLLQSHYNTFHADMIQRAMNDDSISAEDFIKGCVAIHTSERDTNDDEFTPAEFQNV